MNIVFVAGANSGGIFGTLTKAINKYTKHKADFLCKQRLPYKFDYDICEAEGFRREDGRSFTIEDVRNILNNADVIHLNLCLPTGEVFGISIEPYLKIIKGKAYHFSGFELRGRKGKWDQLNGLKIVDNLDLLQYIKDGHWLPNPVPSNEKLYTPDLFKSMLMKGFCTDITSPNKWANTKGLTQYMDIIKKKSMKYKGKIFYDFIQGVTRNECLARKRICHIYAGELWLPNYENSVKECASQGLVIINQKVIHEDLYQYPPFIWADKGNLARVIDDLINWPMKEIIELGKKTREWCIKLHDDKMVITKLIELYETYL